MFNHTQKTLTQQLEILQTDAGIAAVIQSALNRNPASASRYLNGARLYLSGAVEAGAAGSVTIASQRRPHRRYTVHTHAGSSACGSSACDCPDFQHGQATDYRGARLCKHIVAACLYRRFGPPAPASQWPVDAALEAGLELEAIDHGQPDARYHSRLNDRLRQAMPAAEWAAFAAHIAADIQARTQEMAAAAGTRCAATGDSAGQRRLDMRQAVTNHAQRLGTGR